ncbi:MAG: anti-sigma factor [Longimicrobiales bacterium]
MTAGVSHEDVMRYLDGELSPDERARVEAQISTSTELQREVAVFGKIKEDFRTMSFGGSESQSVWERVNRRLTRPVGWVLIVSGSFVLTLYGIYLYLISAANLLEKLASAAIVIGVVILLGSVIYERYRNWLTDPYRDVQT